jgi:hypothetical protein
MRMSVQIPRVRLIFKVLVVGRDLALQTGFLTQVSGNSVSTHLFNTLGVSLGIARYEENDEFAVALQLWTIPLGERVAGLSESFTKGHRAVIAVVRPHELHGIHEIFHTLSLDYDSKAIVVIVGNYDEALEAYLESGCLPREDFQPVPINDAMRVITHLSRRLMNKEQALDPFPIYYVLDEAVCPIFEPHTQRTSEIECTDEEIYEIRDILLDQGLRVTGDACSINMIEGLASVSLRTGTVRLQPEICKFCNLHCKRNANVCIIAVDSGWSSQGISQKALLIAAKVFALAERNIPTHVEAQLERASLCGKFELNPDFEEDEIPIEILNPYQKQSTQSKSLLEAAEDRVKKGKLPRWAYNMLKKRLMTLKEASDNL